MVLSVAELDSLNGTSAMESVVLGAQGLLRSGACDTTQRDLSWGKSVCYYLVFLHVYVPHMCRAFRDQNRLLDPLQLEFQKVTRHHVGDDT